jgi:hypothetical protein
MVAPAQTCDRYPHLPPRLIRQASSIGNRLWINSLLRSRGRRLGSARWSIRAFHRQEQNSRDTEQHNRATHDHCYSDLARTIRAAAG